MVFRRPAAGVGDFAKLPSPYYRVGIQAVIYDERMRLLVLESADGTYHLPGGDWRHKQDFETCLRRTLHAQLGVDVLYIGHLWFSYQGVRRGQPPALKLCVPVQLDTFDFKLGAGVQQAFFIDHATFLNTAFAADEAGIKQHADDLWLPVEKNKKNR